MTIFKLGSFVSHSGLVLDWKIDCDALTADDYRCLVHIICNDSRFKDYGKVISVPTGGDNLMNFLKPFEKKDSKLVIVVDDVMTTGNSIIKACQDAREIYKEKDGYSVIGLVLFNRLGTYVPKVEVLFEFITY